VRKKSDGAIVIADINLKNRDFVFFPFATTSQTVRIIQTGEVMTATSNRDSGKRELISASATRTRNETVPLITPAAVLERVAISIKIDYNRKIERNI
jgi:hypothetical protein